MYAQTEKNKILLHDKAVCITRHLTVDMCIQDGKFKIRSESSTINEINCTPIRTPRA